MSARVDAAGRPSGSVRFWRGYARVVVGLRWVVIAAWLLGAAASALFLPAFGSGSDDLEDIGAGDASLAAEQRSTEIFGFPLLSRIALVQHNDDGLPPLAQAEAVARGAAVTQGAYAEDEPAVLAAVPVTNTGDFPASTGEDTTVLTYLFVDPTVGGFVTQRDIAVEFAETHVDDVSDAYVGVTGSVPARAAQTEIVLGWVHVVEAATLLAVLVVVAVTFRSITAPLVTLLSVGTAVVVTLGVSATFSRALGFSVPSDFRPLIVALLLGVVTDYCIFYLSGLRTRLAEGCDRLEAARLATASVTPIVAVAGLTVAAGTGSLIAAQSAMFRGFGPALAMTVLVGVVVAITFVPAVLAVTGRWALAPHDPADDAERLASSARPTALTRTVTRRGPAALVALVCVAGLAAAAFPVRDLDLGLGFVQSLPGDDPVAAAADAASDGFAPGVVSPTELLLEGAGIAADPAALQALGDAVEAQPGVAGVLGPGESTQVDDLELLVAPDGNAVRYLVVLEDTPLEATAIEHLDGLRGQLPTLLAESGLGEPTVSIAGDTALAASIIQSTRDDLLRISLAALAANLLMLMIFLRSAVAPLYLLGSSVLAVSASLGLTTLLFQGVLGHDDLTFYVPFAVAVLLLSLGSDYNIFAVGHVWQLARDRPMIEAMRVAVPQSTRAITSAGLALAASFGLLALVPLRPFRELGFALAVGILIDVFVVRALLVPALLTLVGPVSSWPSRRLRPRTDADRAAAGGDRRRLRARPRSGPESVTARA